MTEEIATYMGLILFLASNTLVGVTLTALVYKYALGMDYLLNYRYFLWYFLMIDWGRFLVVFLDKEMLEDWELGASFEYWAFFIICMNIGLNNFIIARHSDFVLDIFEFQARLPRKMKVDMILSILGMLFIWVICVSSVHCTIWLILLIS